MRRILSYSLLSLLTGGLLLSASSASDIAASDSVAPRDVTAPRDVAVNPAQQVKKRKPSIQITPQREAVALAFLRQYHSELADLLIPLQQSHPKEFARAIQDLYRSSERLDQFRQRDMVRYELELSLWKVRSRIQLMAARLKMDDSPELREQLRKALDQRVELRITILHREREKVTGRLDKLTQSIQKLEATRDQDVERQFQHLTRNAKNKTQRKQYRTTRPATN